MGPTNGRHIRFLRPGQPPFPPLTCAVYCLPVSVGSVEMVGWTGFQDFAEHLLTSPQVSGTITLSTPYLKVIETKCHVLWKHARYGADLGVGLAAIKIDLHVPKALWVSAIKQTRAAVPGRPPLPRQTAGRHRRASHKDSPECDVPAMWHGRTNRGGFCPFSLNLGD